MSRQNCLDKICVGLAGRAAEVMVFGEDASTTGAKSDLEKVTATASKFVRQHGFDNRLSKTDTVQMSNENMNTDVAMTNPCIEAILVEQYARAKELLNENSAVFMQIAQELVECGEVSTSRFASWLGIEDITEQSLPEPYANRLAAFEARLQLMDRLAVTPTRIDTTSVLQ